MTTATTDTDRISLIHETGYWRVVVHPTVYEPTRMRSLVYCQQIVQESKVSLRGWDYPQINLQTLSFHGTWVQSGSAWANHVELWRFYQTGQFVQQRALLDDREYPSLTPISGPSRPRAHNQRRLDYVEVVYTMTEVFEFIRGLAYRGVLEPAAEIWIELHGVEGRMLSAPPSRILNGLYRAQADTISWHRVSQSSIELLGAADEIALDATVAILKGFGWENPSLGLLREEQRRLLERRL